MKASLFLAYPSTPKQIAESMRRLGELLSADGHKPVLWEDLSAPGPLFPQIASAISASDALVAEVTNGNPNVMFEVGCAVGMSKPVFQLVDRNAAKPRNLPPLDYVRQIRYEKREDVIEELRRVSSISSLAEEWGIPYREGRKGSLYFIPTRSRTDWNDTVLNVCQRTLFDVSSIDWRDTDYDSLSAQMHAIADADVFVTLLADRNYREAWDNNAQLMLYAGVAAGLQKDFVVVIPETGQRILDLEDHALPAEDERQVEFKLAKWLEKTASLRFRDPLPRVSIRPRKASTISGLFFGSGDARADSALKTYFIPTPHYEQAERGHRHLFVGSKGSGKTANYEQLLETFEKRNAVTVAIAPADFEFPRLATVFDEQLASAHWEFVYGSFWRFILISEALRTLRVRFLDHLLVNRGQPHAKLLLEWLDGNEDLLKLDFTSRVSAMIDAIRNVTGTDDDRRREFERLLQAARMYDVESALKEFTKSFELRLLLDDLDRNWNPLQRGSNRLVLALLNEVQGLQTRLRPNVKCAAFIRRDVYDWLVENDPEILKRDPARLEWTKEGLEILIATRIAAYQNSRVTDPDELWWTVFPKFTLNERTQDFIIRRTLLRPRDVVQFCQRALEAAQHAGRERISEDDVFGAWERSGELLLIQIETEYADRYPYLSELVMSLFGGARGRQWTELQTHFTKLCKRLRGKAAWIRAAEANRWLVLRALFETGIVGVRHPQTSDEWYRGQRTLTELEAMIRSDQVEVIIHLAFTRYLRCAD